MSGESVRVSCVIPAYNEAATVADVVRAARACAGIDEIIVVSDGSADATPRIAGEAGADQVIALFPNRGKGNAVLEAAAHARGDILLLLDGDLVGLSPQHLAQLLAPVLAGRAEMAVALFADDPWHGLLRSLSGQRAIVRRLLLLHPDELKRTGFGLEIALDRLVRERRVAAVQVTWRGVRHRSKQEKYGTVTALRLKMRASSDLVRQARRAVRRRRPAAAQTLPPMAMPSSDDRLLVIVAHPDDEVIGAGGLIAAARAVGASVTVLVITNGDSNRLSAAVLAHRVRPRAAHLVEEGRVRQGETLAALLRLGVPSLQVLFLGFPDRGLEQVIHSPAPVRSPFTHFSAASYPDVVAPGAPYTRQALVGLVRQIVAEVHPTAIVSHAPFDRHADHRAVAALVEVVRGDIPTYVFVVHAPGFPRPLRSSWRDPLTPPPSVHFDPAWKWVRFDLTPDAEHLKQDALNAYRSQLATPYLRLLLASFVRTNELFAVRRP